MITAGGRCAGNQRASVISWVYALSSQNAATARPTCRMLPCSGEPRYTSVARNLRVFTGSGEARTGRPWSAALSIGLSLLVWQAGPRTAGDRKFPFDPLAIPVGSWPVFLRGFTWSILKLLF